MKIQREALTDAIYFFTGNCWAMELLVDMGTIKLLSNLFLDDHLKNSMISRLKLTVNRQ